VYSILSSYSQSNPIGLKSNRQSIDFEGYRLKLLDFVVKGPKSIVFRSDCTCQFRKSKWTAIGFSFMNSNSAVMAKWLSVITFGKVSLCSDSAILHSISQLKQSSKYRRTINTIYRQVKWTPGEYLSFFTRGIKNNDKTPQSFKIKMPTLCYYVYTFAQISLQNFGTNRFNVFEKSSNCDLRNNFSTNTSYYSNSNRVGIRKAKSNSCLQIAIHIRLWNLLIWALWQRNPIAKPIDNI
jgi:hypothetical protein